MRLSFLTPKFLLLLFSLPEFSSAASSILGIDLGQEYFKAALVKPGIPLEIVLTKDSRRKESSAIAFKPSRLTVSSDGYKYPDRIYGTDAANLAARLPAEVYPNLKQLLGKNFIDQSISEYSVRYPALELMQTDGRPTTGFKSSSSPPGDRGIQCFSVEELLAMQLKNIQRNALALAADRGKAGVIEDVVFAIPTYFTAEEKYSLQLAAEMAGLKTMAMISDGVAISINYATGREFKPEDQPETHVIYDMGAGSTTATVVKFTGKTVKDLGKFKKDITEVSVLGVGWDRELGGDLFNGKVMDHLLNDFFETPRAKKIAEEDATFKDKVRLNGRSVAKLWREATKVRHVLSANSEAYASVESLYGDMDYRSSKITRAQFEESLQELVDRVTKPLYQALESAGLTLEGIDSVIFHGGGLRVPWVSKLLEGVVGEKKISRTVNSDEAAVMGATFRGAALSNSFRVKEIVVKDVNVYAVGASYQKDGSEKEIHQVVFPPTTTLGTEKFLPIKRTTDFSFYLTETIVNGAPPPNIEQTTKITTKNLTATAARLASDFNCVDGNVRTEFQIRLRERDGLPEVIGAWAGCNVEVPELSMEDSETGEKGKNEKSGGVLDDVKDFLGLKRKNKDTERSTPTGNPSTPPPGGNRPNREATMASEDLIPEPALKIQEGGLPTVKIVTKFEKIPVELEIVKAGFPQVPFEVTEVSKNKILGFDNHDAVRLARDAVFNDLESTVYKLRDLLSDQIFLSSSPAETTERLTLLIEQTGDWLYESSGGDIAPGDEIKERLKTLVDLADPVRARMEEHRKRPEQVKLVREAVTQVEQLVQLMEETVQVEESNKEERRRKKDVAASASAAATPDAFDDLEDKPENAEEPGKEEVVETETPPTYSTEDIASLRLVIKDITAFLDEKLAAQERLPLTVDPIITVKELDGKVKLANAKVVEFMTKQIRVQEEMERQQAAERVKRERERKKAEKEAKASDDRLKRQKDESKSEGAETANTEEVMTEEKKKHDEL